MSKIILPATCIFLLIIAYQFHRLQTERLTLLGEMLLMRLVDHENGIQNKSRANLLAGLPFDDAMEASLQTSCVELREKTGEVLYQKRLLELKPIHQVRHIISESFLYEGKNVEIRNELEIGSIMKPYQHNVNIFSLYSFLLLSILFFFASFLIMSLVSKSRLEKNRIAMQNKQNDFEKQLEIVKHEKKEQDMKKEMEVKEKQLILADKMSSLGVLSSGIAHEINNPNTYIQMNAQTLQKAWKDVEPHLVGLPDDLKIAGIPLHKMKGRIPELAQAIVEGSVRIEKIVADLKSFSGNNDSAQVDCVFAFHSVLEGAIRLTENFVKKNCLHFHCQFEKDLQLLGNPQKLEQVIINLIINACQALGDENKRIELNASAKTGRARFTIKDEGQGISKENIKHIFDPFFTTKSDNGGTGLGLAISYAIISKMGGEIKVESEQGKYTMFIIDLPLAKKENEVNL